MDLFFRGSHTTNFVTCGLSRSYSHAAEVPSSKVTCKSPRSPSINCRIMLAFVSMTDSITTLPTEFLTAIEILSLCTSMPIYLVLLIKGVLSGRVEPNTQNPTPKVAPFYIASGGFNGSTQHSSRTRLALKTKAKSLARVRSAGTLPWLGFDRGQPNRALPLGNYH